MHSAGDQGAAMHVIFNKGLTAAPEVNYKRPITAGEIQDKLRSQHNDYSENNPEPPSMKD